MTRQAGFAIQNDFRAGLVSEATGLNFPENACTETFDCIHNLDGSIQRREGLDFEANNSLKAINVDSSVIATFLWKDVSGDGNTYLLVKQVGDHLYFYDASTDDPISAHALATNIDLTAFSPSGAPSPKTQECQFASGNGLLFVTHPWLEAFYVSFDTNTAVATATQIDLTVRDFKGLTDATDIATRPTSGIGGLSTAHHYNLLNQGWEDTSPASPGDSSALTTWDSGRTDMPSDCDVKWRFKDSNGAFSVSATVMAAADIGRGNSPAPKGHYKVNVFDEDRQTPSGITINNVTTGYQRCSTCAFFAGRVFYSGINYVGYNSKVYFTQIVERNEQYGYCYQVNDPTAEDLFDLLPTDGGVIDIQEAGTVIKMIPVPGGLAVFATNGVWFISGSTGLGFTANDYSVSKLSSIKVLTHTSFVDIGGIICWWNLEGIYTLTMGGQNGAADIKSITHDKLLTFFYDIPPSSKRNARGYFNTVTGIVQWLYRSTEAGTLDESYQYDRILNFNVLTDSFYPWRISSSDVKVNSLVVVENLGGQVSIDNVIDDAADQVVDDSGDVVVVFTINDGIVVPKFKYLVSYADGAPQYQFTFAEESDEDYVDWMSYDSVGVSFSSTFTTGFKLRGQAIKKFQPTYVRIFSKDAATRYMIQGVWDYANDEDTNRFSDSQSITHTGSHYTYLSKRIKLRGHGLVYQIKITSTTGQPFNIIGWAEYDTSNALP